jgi:hypothetical protein
MFAAPAVLILGRIKDFMHVAEPAIGGGTAIEAMLRRDPGERRVAAPGSATRPAAIDFKSRKRIFRDLRDLLRAGALRISASWRNRPQF